MNIMLTDKNILVLAAGGAGMNVLIQYLLGFSANVSGMDRSFDRQEKNRIKNCLIQKGMKLLSEKNFGHHLSFDLIISSPAIEQTHPVIKHAKQQNIPVLLRTEYLSKVFNQNFGIGIAGTSGKTSITGMLAVILNFKNNIFKIFCGDEILNFSKEKTLGNYIEGVESKLLMELDESDKSLGFFKPDLSCISSIEKDHYELDQILWQFERLTSQSKKVVINLDSNLNHLIYKKFKSKCITVSTMNPNADFYAKLIDSKPGKITYSINNHTGTLNISGSYNIYNALVSCAIAKETGISLKDSLIRLSTFKGIRNRFEVTCKHKNYYILDFAHNPEKISFSIQSAKSYGLPVIYIFQPHGYAPLRFMLQEYKEVFLKHLKEDDILILLKVYDAGGTTDRSIQSSHLIKEINLPNAVYMDSREKLKEYIRQIKCFYTYVIAGARDETLRTLKSEISDINVF